MSQRLNIFFDDEYTQILDKLTKELCLDSHIDTVRFCIKAAKNFRIWDGEVRKRLHYVKDPLDEIKEGLKKSNVNVQTVLTKPSVQGPIHFGTLCPVHNSRLLGCGCLENGGVKIIGEDNRNDFNE